MFYKIGVLKNFTEFTGKYLHFGLRSYVSDFGTGFFQVKQVFLNFVKFLRTPFLIEHFLFTASEYHRNVFVNTSNGIFTLN